MKRNLSQHHTDRSFGTADNGSPCRILLGTLGLLLLATGCSQEADRSLQRRPSLPSEHVIATYGEGGRVTVAELVNHVLEKGNRANPLASLLQINHPAYDMTADEWAEQQLDTLVLHRIVAEMAKEEGLDRQEEHDVFMQDWLQLTLAQRLQYEAILKEIAFTEDEIREYYEGNPSEFVIPARMKLQGIYAEKEVHGEREARERIETARRRILAGEDFVTVAGEFSDADINLRGKTQTELKETELPTAIVEAVVAVPQGSVSRVVELPKIFAIYRAEKLVQRSEKSLNEATSGMIEKKLYDERYGRLERKLFSDLQSEHQPVYRPEWLEKVPNEENYDDPILAVGDAYSRSFRQFYTRAEDLGYSSTPGKLEYLEFLTGRALAYVEALDRGWTEQTVEARLIPHRNTNLYQLYIHSLLDENAATDDAMRDFYEENKEIFITDREMRVYNIFIPAMVTPQMESLQINAAVKKAAGQAEYVLNLARQGQPFPLLAKEYSRDPLTVNAEYGMDRVTYRNVRPAYLPHFNDQLPKMTVGQVSHVVFVANHTTGRYGAEIFYLAEEKPSRQMAFEETFAQQKAKMLLLAEQQQEVERKLNADTLSAANIQIDKEGAATLVKDLRACATDPVQAIGLWEYAIQ